MIKKYALLVATLMFIFALFLVNVQCAEKIVYLRDGGNGDGTTAEQPTGDFREAVKQLKKTGGTIVVCGRYTVSELLYLSEKSGTSNGNKVIKVTSVDGSTDYRTQNNAALCIGDGQNSANIILAGSFVFENITINTSGSERARAIIANGNSVVLGDGIVCSKSGNAPFISVIGGSLDGDIKKGYELVIKSGSYNNICASNKNGDHTGDSQITIDGGIFDGDVSVTGLEGSNFQKGKAILTINGGTFKGRVGAVTGAETVYFTINGGNFNKDIVVIGKNNTVDVNGGNLQKVGSVSVVTVEQQNDNKKPNGNEQKSVININEYSGDVNKLASKMIGENLVININTQGGSDAEPENTVVTETVLPDVDKNPEKPIETEPVDTDLQDSMAYEREYFLGSRDNTILAIVFLSAVVFSSVVVIIYRAVYRKKQ